MNDLSINERFDVHRVITEAIIAAIEAGAGEFVLPWHSSGAAIAKPENARTKMQYHGINVLALWAKAHSEGFGSGYWASYKQWQQLGAQVESGQHGTVIVFYKQMEGDERHEGEHRNRPLARASRVFNADQVSGWTSPASVAAKEPVKVIEAASAFVDATKAIIFHKMEGGAFYDIRCDTITLPNPVLFVGTDASTATEEYYATLLHELVHWSGASHRLARKLFDVSKQERASEELVAEIGAAFLCADLGVTNAPRPQHAAYIASWLELLRSDTSAVFTASRLAHQAAVYLHGLSEPESH